MQKRLSKWRVGVIRSAGVYALLLCCALSASHAYAQDQAAPGQEDAAAARDVVSVKMIQDQINILEQAGTLDEKKTAALDLLRKALVSAQQADEFAAKQREYQQIVKGVPERLKEYEARLAQPIKEPQIAPDDKTTDQVRQEVSSAQAALDAARQARQNSEQETASRTQRRELIPPEVATMRGQLSDVEQRLLAPINDSEDSTLSNAQRLNLMAEQRRLQQNIAMLEEELRSYDARRDTLRLRRQVGERDVVEAEKVVQAWQAVMTAREQQEAQRLSQQAREAQVEAESVHPLVAELAETNRVYAKERTDLVPKVERATSDLKDVESTLQRLSDDFRSVKTRVEQSGTTTTIGLLLRNKRASLPDVAEHERALRERQAEISRVQLLRSDLDDELLYLVNIEAAAEQLVAGRDDIPLEMRDSIKEAVIEQLRRRKEEFIPGLIVAIDSYLEDTLVRLDQSEAQLVSLLNQYNVYVDERILWIRSANPVSVNTVKDAIDASKWTLSAQRWQETVQALWSNTKSNWATVTPPMFLLLLLGVLQHVARKRIDEIAVEIRSFSTDTLGRTFTALGLTALCVIVTPAFLWFLSSRIAVSSDVLTGEAGIFARSVAEGLSRVARFLLVALSLWYLCRPRGLVEAHFRWRISSLKLIRRNLYWIIPAAIPAVFVVGMMEYQPNESYKASLGRVALLVLAISLAVFVAHVLRPKGGILQGYLSRKAGGWLDQLRYVWYSAAVGIPIALGIASLAGYHYTAVQLGRTMNKTFALIIGATILHALLVRWLLVAQRKLAMEQARKRRAAQAEAAAAAAQTAAAVSASASADGAGMSPATQPVTGSDIALDVPDIDITAIGEQSRRLMFLGVWFALVMGLLLAWSDVLPALGALRTVVLTEQVQTITETVIVDGVASVQAMDRLVPITLADVMLSIVAIVLTIVAARNLPGVLEITILQRLPLAPSGRYAVSTLVKYVLIITGIVVAFSLIGVGWSKVQWLAAAITVGLGFGLQEIFANFVSGIIILFEQPIRVGDIVTINDISGTVTKIRMRATTIRDWDRKELVIPNKLFVTDNIVNWTLSDTMLRVRIPVGVAYGSDTERARDELLKAARAHPLVLRDPEPQAWFTGFGDSTLDFELRVFIGHIDHLLTVRHGMHAAIDQAFRKAGVEIAFPQRDLHIRSGLELLQPKPMTSQRDDARSDKPS